MKVTITEKGEGFIIAKFAAIDHVEHLILETCGMGETETACNLGRAYGPSDKQTVTFNTFRIPVHSVLEEKKP